MTEAHALPPGATMTEHDPMSAGDVGANVRAKGFSPLRETEIGPLPAHWQVVRLGEVVEKTKQIDPRRTPNWKFQYIDVSCISSESLKIVDYQIYFGKDAPSRARKLVVAGDVIFATVRPYLRRIAMIPPELDGQICSTAFCVLRPKPDLVDGRYLFFSVSRDHFVTDVSEYQRGSSYPAVTDNDVLNRFIPLPPLAEQRAIAHVLRTVQQAKESTERVIAALRALKKSLMRYLFTYGPVPVGARHVMSLRETEIGPLPAHWQVVRLGEVVEKTKQIDPRRTPNWKFQYIDVSCISSESLKIVDYQIYFGKDAPSRARKLVVAGDVIFATVRPYLRRIAMIPPELDGQICSTAFCVLRPKPDLVDGRYLFFSVSRDHFVTDVSEYQRGSSYPAVTDNDVLNRFIPLPPLAEQRAIADILRSVDRRIAAEEGYRAALDSLFKTLLHDLMTGRVRVPMT